MRRGGIYLSVDYSDSDVVKTAEEVSVVKEPWWGAQVIGSVGCGKNATGAVTRGQNGEEKKTALFLFPRSYQLILCVGHVSYMYKQLEEEKGCNMA